MSNLDSLLSFMKQADADELRLGSGKQPQMLSRGVPKRITIAATDDSTLRFLLAGILTPETETALAARGELELAHDAGALGKYRVALKSRNHERGFDAVVRVGVEHEQVAAGEQSVEAHAVASAPASVSALSRLDPKDAERVEPAPGMIEPAPEMPAHVVAPSAALLLLLRTAVSRKASDIHLAQGAGPTLRIDGRLHASADDSPVDMGALLQLGSRAQEQLSRGHCVEFSVSDPGGGSARVHVYSTVDGIAAAIRLLPPHAPSLDSLHLPMPLDDLVTLPHGLVLVAGASGSGKSTTIAALVQAALHRRSVVVITLEDPIEYVLEAGSASLVRRREVGRDVRSFADGLRDALREDPDLLLVGELRDAEAIQMAVTAAETGHLVFATLHARSAPSAITRLIDAYPAGQQEQARRQLAESLRAVVAQRLLPRARPPGRVPAVEVLRVNHAAASLIREGKTSQLGTVMQAAQGEGMVLLERCLANQVKDGIITLEAARAAASDPSSLEVQLGAGTPR
ncbi:MAG: PilT/PilU family type 4a pilus ATPase [Polyangiaceae bacterium]|nr:PilT/PilU family type 4a pilus ATPase [Polyangiaceae bacterium]